MNFVSDRAIYVAQVHFGVLVPLVVLTTGVLVTRVYIKTRNGQNLKAGDWFMIAGWVSDNACLDCDSAPDPNIFC